MKPPMIGPATGPMNVAPAKRPRANPRSTGPQKSARAPPMMARGAEPNVPAKKRASIMVSTLVATATGIWKMAKTKKAMKRGGLRPYSSERGPQMTGPTAKPCYWSEHDEGIDYGSHARTKRLVPRVMTSIDTPNSSDVAVVAVLNTLLAKVRQKVTPE